MNQLHNNLLLPDCLLYDLPPSLPVFPPSRVCVCGDCRREGKLFVRDGAAMAKVGLSRGGYLLVYEHILNSYLMSLPF